jgi:hypothetical protein
MCGCRTGPADIARFRRRPSLDLALITGWTRPSIEFHGIPGANPVRWSNTLVRSTAPDATT